MFLSCRESGTGRLFCACVEVRGCEMRKIY